MSRIHIEQRISLALPRQTKLALSILGVDATESNVDPKWIPFPLLVEGLGIELVPIRDLEAQDYFLSVEFNGWSGIEVPRSVQKKNRILVCVEPACVNPVQFSPRIQSKFGNIIKISEHLGPGKFDAHWDGGHLPSRENILSIIEKNQSIQKITRSVGMLNANKFSAHSDSLYGFRYKVLQQLLREKTADVYLGGRDWNKNYSSQFVKTLHSAAQTLASGSLPNLLEFIPRNLRGLQGITFIHDVDDQVGFFRPLEFGIAIENQEGYMSEKLLNVLLGGAIPLYYGSNPEDFGVPRDAVVDVKRQFGGDFRLAFLEISADIKRKTALAEAGKKYVTSDDCTSRWGVQEGQKKLVSLVGGILNLE